MGDNQVPAYRGRVKEFFRITTFDRRGNGESLENLAAHTNSG